MFLIISSAVFLTQVYVVARLGHVFKVMSRMHLKFGHFYSIYFKKK